MKTRYIIDVDHYNDSAVVRVEQRRDSLIGERTFGDVEVRLLRDVKVNLDCGTSETLTPPDNMGVRHVHKKANGDFYLSFGGWLSDVAPTPGATA